MNSKLLLLMIFLTASIFANAQESTPPTVEARAKTSDEKPEPTKDSVEKPEPVKDKTTTPDDSDKINRQPNQTQQSTYVRPNGKKRFSRYLDNVVGPTAFIGPLFGAGINTATNSPEEWGGQWNGFGRRFASEIGKNAIKETTTYALDEAFKLDSYYYRSTKSGFFPRLKHAVISSVTARNKNGKTVFGFPRIAGGYASEIIAYETWYPKRFGVKDGFRDGTISIGTNALINIFREFVFK